MVRRPKRPAVRELSARKIACDRMDHRDFKKFAGRQRRQDRWEARGEHALASAGRPVEQAIVSYYTNGYARMLGHADAESLSIYSVQ